MTNFRNTSPWPSGFLKKMLRWIMREMDVPRASLRGVYFRKRSNPHWSGRAFAHQRRIVVSIGLSGYPERWSGYSRACRPQNGGEYLTIQDAFEALVITTAHELGHIRHFAQGHFCKGSEDLADPPARMVLRRFREARESLLSDWQACQSDNKDNLKTSITEKRFAKAAAALARWQRKMKLAKTKVSVYRRKVKYYEKRAAVKH
jgi:hypothetical protein